MHTAKSTDKVAKLEGVRRRVSEVLSKNVLINPCVVFSVLFAAAILKNYTGLEFQRRYILINRVLAKIEQEGGAE